MKSIVAACVLAMSLTACARVSDDLSEARADHARKQKDKKRRMLASWKQLEAQGKKITEIVDEYVLLQLKEEAQELDEASNIGDASALQLADSAGRVSKRDDVTRGQSCCCKTNDERTQSPAATHWSARLEKTCCGIACQCCSILRDARGSLNARTVDDCCKKQQGKQEHHMAADCTHCKHDHKQCKHAHKNAALKAFCKSCHGSLIASSMCVGVAGMIIFYLLSSIHTKNHCTKKSCC